MGVLNVTPDSFSDGGEFLDPDRAVEHAREMVSDGADIVDVGGESTRPGSDPVSVSEERDRVVPVIERLVSDMDVPISVDTMKPEVAAIALPNDKNANIVDLGGTTKISPRVFNLFRGGDTMVLEVPGRTIGFSLKTMPGKNEAFERACLGGKSGR